MVGDKKEKEKLLLTGLRFDVKDFKKAFKNAAGSGLFVSIGDSEAAGKFDGSGSVLREDAAWLTWNDIDHNSSWGYVWNPNHNDDVVVCGYPIDGGTLGRRINGRFDRCGQWAGVPTVVFPLLLLLIGFVTFCIAQIFLKIHNSVAVAVLTVVFIQWFFWIYDRHKPLAGTTSATFAAENGVIKRVLREQTFVYGCPKSKAVLTWLYLILFLTGAGSGAAILAHKLKQPPFIIGCVFFAALTVAAAFVGYVNDNRKLNPLPQRCFWENEFVYLPQVKGMVKPEYVAENAAYLPVALLYMYKPGEKWDEGKYINQFNFWDEKTQVLKMKFATKNGESHKFDGVFNLDQKEELQEHMRV